MNTTTTTLPRVLHIHDNSKVQWRAAKNKKKKKKKGQVRPGGSIMYHGAPWKSPNTDSRTDVDILLSSIR